MRSSLDPPGLQDRHPGHFRRSRGLAAARPGSRQRLRPRRGRVTEPASVVREDDRRSFVRADGTSRSRARHCRRAAPSPGAYGRSMVVTSRPKSQSSGPARSPGATADTPRRPRAPAAPAPGPKVIEAGLRRAAARWKAGGRGRSAPRRRRGRRADPRRGRGSRRGPRRLQRHRRALGEEGQHLVVGVAEQRDAPVHPARQRRVVEEPHRKQALDRGEQRAGGPAPAREGAAEGVRAVAAGSSPRRSRRRAPRRRRS